MPVDLPYTLHPGDDILAEILQSNFQALVDHFSGGLVDADCSVLMGLNGAKVAVNTMPGDRIATGTIAKLQMGAASVGTPQLEALGVTKDKLTVTVGQKITKAQMELKTFATVGMSIVLGSATLLSITCDMIQAVVAGVNSWVPRLHVTSFLGTSVAGSAYYVLTPVTAIPVISTTPFEPVLKNQSGVTGIVTIDVDFHYLENS